MTDLTNVLNFFAFAFGFATGTYVGLVIEERLSIGMVILRIITPKESEADMAAFFQAEHYGTTIMDAKGVRGDMQMILSLVNRSEVHRIVSHNEKTIPSAFYSIEDVRYVNQGVFRQRIPMPLPAFSMDLSVSGRKITFFINGSTLS